MRKNGVTIESNLHLFVGSYARFQSFGVHRSMNAESAIEKLQQIAMEKET
jgi:hypothetical protein